MSKFKLIAALLPAILLTGCFSNAKLTRVNIDQAYKLAKDDSGIIFGAAGVFIDESVSAARLCAFINNSDPRCSQADEYVGVAVWSAFGFYAGSALTIALAPKNSSVVQDIAYFRGRVGNSKQPYVKARAIKGQFATVLEVVSTHGDEKCYWQGLPRAGGTICPQYDWDYRKNIKSWDSKWGVLSVD